MHADAVVNPIKRMALPQPGERLTLILKPAGSRCNIDCTYCYDKRRDLAAGGYLRMEDLKALMSVSGEHPLDVVLHGGESLMVPHDRLMAYVEELRKHAAGASFSIVTNGLLLTESRLNMLREDLPELAYTVSFDGPDAASRFRVDHSGLDTSQSVTRALDLLNDNGVAFSIISVATTALRDSEVALLDACARYKALDCLSITPCLDYDVRQSDSGRRFRSPQNKRIDAVGGLAPWALLPAEYSTIVLKAYQHWIDEGYFRRFRLEPVHSALLSIDGAHSGSTDYGVHKQPYILTLNSDGLVSSSDEFESREALIGPAAQLDAPIAELIKTKPEGLWKKCEDLLAVCEGCSHKSSCRGGGLPDRLAYIGDDAMGRGYCDARRWLIDGVEAGIRDGVAGVTRHLQRAREKETDQ